jgi:hypothetical protein
MKVDKKRIKREGAMQALVGKQKSKKWRGWCKDR